MVYVKDLENIETVRMRACYSQFHELTFADVHTALARARSAYDHS